MKNERESRLLCDVMPENGNLLSCPYHLRPNDVARGADVTMSSRSQRSPSTSPRQRRASACGWSAPHHSQLLASGYEQYQKSLLEVPWPADYGEASSDDLSSEWDSDVPDVPSAPPSKPSGWRKLRNIVQWTPFFQTYKKQRYPWVQLAGHQGNFKAGPEQGTILKKLCPKEELCFQVLMKDVLRPYVPEYKGHVTCEDGDCILVIKNEQTNALYIHHVASFVEVADIVRFVNGCEETYGSD